MNRLLRILVSVGLLVLIVRVTGDIGSLGRQIAGLSLSATVLALLLNTGNRALMTYKWLRLLSMRGHYMSLLQGIKIYCSSIIWGMFLPATVGADAIRATCTIRHGIPPREVIASIGIERIIGGLATPLLALAALMLMRLSGSFDSRLDPIWWVSLLVIASGIVVLLVTFDGRFHNVLHHRLMGRLQRFKLFQLLEQSHETFRAYRSARGELGLFLLLTLAENCFPILVMWIIGQGLGLSVPFISVAAAVPLAYLVARIPFSIGGIGVYEGVFVLILVAADVPMEGALAMALLARVLQIVAWLPWWFAYTMEGGKPGRTAGDAVAP